MLKPINKILVLFLALSALLMMCSCGSDSQESVQISSSDNRLFLPIIMYHSVLADDENCNEYVTDADTLKADIQYLRDNGYTAVSLTQIIDYVYNGKPLPEKPVVLTFDDGCYNFLTVVMPILRENNFCATLSVVGSFAQKEKEQAQKQSSLYSYLTFEQIKEISKCGYVEIASHSYNMHSLGKRKGSLKLETESYEEYRSRFLSDVLVNNKLLSDNCSVTPVAYTYPYGFVCEESLELVKACRFQVSLGVEERANYITSDPECLYCLNRYNRPHGISTEEFMEKVLSP